MDKLPFSRRDYLKSGAVGVGVGWGMIGQVTGQTDSEINWSVVPTPVHGNTNIVVNIYEFPDIGIDPVYIDVQNNESEESILSQPLVEISRQEVEETLGFRTELQVESVEANDEVAIRLYTDESRSTEALLDEQIQTVSAARVDATAFVSEEVSLDVHDRVHINFELITEDGHSEETGSLGISDTVSEIPERLDSSPWTGELPGTVHWTGVQPDEHSGQNSRLVASVDTQRSDPDNAHRLMVSNPERGTDLTLGEVQQEAFIVVESADTDAGNEVVMFGGDLENTGRYSSTSIIDNVGVDWSYDTEERLTSNPIITNGTLYGSSDSENLYAIDVESGELEWVYESGIPRAEKHTSGHPTIHNGRVYVSYGIAWSEEDHEFDGLVTALDAENGDTVWSETYEEEDFVTSPVVANGLVYVGTRFGSLYALDAETGATEWSRSHGIMRGVPAVSNGHLITYDNRGIVSLDPLSGEQQWHYDTIHGIQSSPAIDGERIFIGGLINNQADSDEGIVYALDLNTGEEEWTFDTNGWVKSSPSIDEDTVYVGSHDGNIYALDKNTGELRWEFSTDGWITGKPAIVEDQVYFGSWGSGLYGVDTNSGESIWSIDTCSNIRAGPVPAGDALYVAGYDRQFYRFVENGDPLPGCSSDSSANIFIRTQDVTDNPLMLGAGGMMLTGLGYAAYKYKERNDGDEPLTVDSLTNTKTTDDVEQSEVGSDPGPNVEDFSNISTSEVIETHDQFQISRATTSTGEEVWTITPTTDAGTIKTNEFETMVDLIVPWAQMDAHPHLLTVYGYGLKPLPWAAIEPADFQSLADVTDDRSVEEKISIIAEVCEAVHHVQRYGIAYRQLSMDSILIDEEGSAILRGIVDQLNSADPVYELPDGDEDPTTEQADVYRLGALAYEAVTGNIPNHPDATPPSEHGSTVPSTLDEVLLQTLATRPTDRQDTVLHLRNALRSTVIT